jgi:anhydro-N-acetylmuramic acid kinase
MSGRWIIGLASGSSATGVSACLAEFEGTGLELQVQSAGVVHQPYARDLRDFVRITEASPPNDVSRACLLHRLLGEIFAATARQAADRASLSLQSVQCIGCPGHTLWHDADGRFPSTLAVGMPAIVAERTGVTTLSDFRSRDVAAGGQGISLDALPDYFLFRHMSESRLVLHLGGIASAVMLPAACRPGQVSGLEIGPCNLLLDGLMRHATNGREDIDSGGKCGAQGHCLEALLGKWLTHSFFARSAPKTLRRSSIDEEFIAPGLDFARTHNSTVNDLICTGTQLIARSIGRALQECFRDCWPPDRLILTGGGTRNGLLRQLLTQQLSVCCVDTVEQHGVPADGRDALAAAILAAMTLDGIAANLPRLSGASGSRLLGSLTPGSSANWARCLSWMAAQTTLLPAALDSMAPAARV